MTLNTSPVYLKHSKNDLSRREGYKYFIGSSGGNAGMAMAVAARKIGKEIGIPIISFTRT